MKIDNTSGSDHLRALDRSKGPAKAEAARPAAPISSGASTQSHLSTADASHQDIDAARVSEIREAIREGRLDIRTDRIADGLINSVRSMLAGKD